MKIKSRTNQPCTYVLEETKNINELSDEFIDNLKCGDIVQKITGEQKHAYIVSYKQEKHGICLTYADAGYTETISYDYTAGHWVFNSKDVVSIYDDVELEQDLKVDGDANVVGDLSVGGDVAITGDVEVKTIAQTEPNWSIDVASQLSDLGYDAEKFLTTITYGKFEVIGNILYFTLNYRVKNISAETQSFGASFIKYLDLRTMPDSLSTKIVDCVGNTLKEGSGDNNARCITGMPIHYTYAGLAEIRNNVYGSLSLSNYGGTSHIYSVQLRQSVSANISLNANDDIYITMRTFLTLI